MLKPKSTCCLCLRKRSQIEASPKEIVVFVWEFCFPVERAAVNSRNDSLKGFLLPCAFSIETTCFVLTFPHRQTMDYRACIMVSLIAHTYYYQGVPHAVAKLG